MIERNHLEIVREVDRCGSLTAAADGLCLTQSALSHAMKKLEQQLGTAVWVREGRKLRPTQSGLYLLSLANRLLPQFEHAEELVGQIARGQRGSLRIGMECHPCYQWLLKVVGPYLEQWPGVDVDVKQRFQFGGIGALFGYDIDVLVTPDPLHRKGLVFEPVFDYEQVLVVPSSHPLASKIFAIEIIQGAPHLKKYLAQEMHHWALGRTQVIQAWIDAGKMDPIDPLHLMFMIWGSTQHYADFATQIEWALDSDGLTEADFEQAERTVTHVILKGIGLQVPQDV
jgi:DNA-binding transcriptional LysR family regulator